MLAKILAKKVIWVEKQVLSKKLSNDSQQFFFELSDSESEQAKKRWKFYSNKFDKLMNVKF